MDVNDANIILSVEWTRKFLEILDSLTYAEGIINI